MNKKMKGVVLLGSRSLTVREHDIPEPGPGEVLVRVKCAGICGSDLNTFRMTWEEIGERQNFIDGHEGGGIVEKVGSGVTKTKPGDRVTLYHFMGCGRCKYCEQGAFTLCDHFRAFGWHMHGTMAEYIICEERCCRVLPDSLGFEESVFIGCSGSTAYEALKKLDGFSSFGCLAIVGLGPIGIVASLIAQKIGWKTIGFDPSKNRVEFASSLGINAFVPEKEISLREQLMHRMNGNLPSRVFDTTGSPYGLADAIDIAEKQGHVVTIAKGKRSYSVDPPIKIGEMIAKEIVLHASWVFTVSDCDEFTSFMCDNDLSFKPVVTARYTLDQAQEAFDYAVDQNNFGKTIFMMD